eukprot:scaffold6363_cov25-Tisochrysis_lutea.AAC.7
MSGIATYSAAAPSPITVPKRRRSPWPITDAQSVLSRSFSCPHSSSWNQLESVWSTRRSANTRMHSWAHRATMSEGAVSDLAMWMVEATSAPLSDFRSAASSCLVVCQRRMDVKMRSSEACA